MNLFIIKDIILNLILITFPILVYLVLVCYRENIDNNNKDTLLTIALITSLYLSLILKALFINWPISGSLPPGFLERLNISSLPV